MVHFIMSLQQHLRHSTTTFPSFTSTLSVALAAILILLLIIPAVAAVLHSHLEYLRCAGIRAQRATLQQEKEAKREAARLCRYRRHWNAENGKESNDTTLIHRHIIITHAPPHDSHRQQSRAPAEPRSACPCWVLC